VNPETLDLQGVDLAHPRQMAPALELRRQPGFHDLERLGLGNRPLADREAVGVVVRTIPNRELFVPANAATHAFDAIGDDGLAIARTTENDTALEFAGGDGTGDREAKVWVVTGSVRVRSKIAHGVTLGEQHRLDCFLVGEARVIGADGDGEFFHGRMLTRDETRLDSGCRYSEPTACQQTKIPMTTCRSLFALTVLLFAAGCSTPASRISRNEEAFSEWPEAIQEKVRAGQIDLGFTPEQVRVALGDPARTVRRTDNDGTSEVWIYHGREPRFSVGLGVGTSRGSTGFGGGVGIGTGGSREREDATRVVFAGGRVSAVEAPTK
jgi:hypothetical protein